MDRLVLVIAAPDGTVERVALGLGAATIGRDPRNTIVLPDRKVSAFHAQIFLVGQSVTIADVGSANGTTLNDAALEKDDRRPLAPGDRVGIGPYSLRLELERPVPPPPDPSIRRPVPIPVPVEPSPPRITPLLPPDQRSRYLELLPRFYAEQISDPDGVLNAILLIAEQILDPIERRVIAQLPAYLDPTTAPAALLPWLSSWVALTLDENWPLARRRDLLRRAAELYRWRGTPRGLRDYIRAFLGVEPLIIEPGRASPPLPDDALRVAPGSPPRLVQTGPEDRRDLAPLAFRVVVPLAEAASDSVTITRLAQIIDAEKPAHATYTLYIRPPASR